MKLVNKVDYFVAGACLAGAIVNVYKGDLGTACVMMLCCLVSIVMDEL